MIFFSFPLYIYIYMYIYILGLKNNENSKNFWIILELSISNVRYFHVFDLLLIFLDLFC